MFEYHDDPTHQAFTSQDSPHILMITNHGIHQWDVVPGLPDTGGQNLFVNMFTQTLAELGFRITIVNRGGYQHPTTGEQQVGLRYKDARQRIVYLQDNCPEFVRKEDMDEHTPQLAQFLWDFLESPIGGYINLIISHYWDGAKIGALVRNRFRDNVPHFWVPHSVGTVKKRNMKPETWENLRIDERIAIEKSLITELTGVAATSPLIRQALVEDYGVERPLFLPPCVDPTRFHPRDIDETQEIYDFVGHHCGQSAQHVRECKIITEISRTDYTKRKDVLIKAFAKVREKCPDSILVVSMDSHEKEIYSELWTLIRELGLSQHVAVVGNIWEWLPDLYAITDVYCSPSVMEGFGMAVQEAAATKVPVVGSNLIPFVTDYLLDGEVQHWEVKGAQAPLKVGRGAIVVQIDDVTGFAAAIERLLADTNLREQMGTEAYRATIPYFTWDGMTRQFLDDIGFGERERVRITAEHRHNLDRETLATILDAECIEDLSVSKLESLIRAEAEMQDFLPDGICQTDPRDGAVIVFHAQRARRPHDNAEPPTEPAEDAAADPICRGETTRVVDVAPLSEGFTFINKNLFPVVYPFENGAAQQRAETDGAAPIRGMHFLQWTSSYFDRDWYNMPQSDRLVAVQRLAALEKTLLLDDSTDYPHSGETGDGRSTYGYVLMMKNCGRLVGGSLAHGHQQIVYSSQQPRHLGLNERFQKEHGKTFAEYMLRKNPDELLVQDYGAAVLLVPYFMRRPYNCMLVLKDHTKRHLFECDDDELDALAHGWGDVTSAIMAFMPAMNKQTAYNVTVNNGSGAGLYCEFLPYTQETGGLEHLGLWVCQENPTSAADRLRQQLTAS